MKKKFGFPTFENFSKSRSAENRLTAHNTILIHCQNVPYLIHRGEDPSWHLDAIAYIITQGSSPSWLSFSPIFYSWKPRKSDLNLTLLLERIYKLVVLGKRTCSVAVGKFGVVGNFFFKIDNHVSQLKINYFLLCGYRYFSLLPTEKGSEGSNWDSCQHKRRVSIEHSLQFLSKFAICRHFSTWNLSSSQATLQVDDAAATTVLSECLRLLHDIFGFPPLQVPQQKSPGAHDVIVFSLLGNIK